MSNIDDTAKQEALDAFEEAFEDMHKLYRSILKAHRSIDELPREVRSQMNTVEMIGLMRDLKISFIRNAVVINDERQKDFGFRF